MSLKPNFKEKCFTAADGWFFGLSNDLGDAAQNYLSWP